jgi:ATP-dependent DNA ligase
VAKRSDQPYVSGKRIWMKAKNISELDVVCGAVIGSLTQPTEIVVGLPIAGELRIVGRTGQLKPAARRALARWLRPPESTHPWPQTVKGTTLDRFNRDSSPVELVLVEPIVVEVLADAAWSGQSFRHALRYRRVRPELGPGDVPFPFDTI